MVPLSWAWSHALLLAGHHEHGQHGDDRAVHGHRHRHLLERDAVEEDLHVLDRVDGHAGLAHVTLHPGVVAVVAAVGGQVEGHRQAHLAGGQVATVEGVGLLGGGEPGVLADGPGPVGVHGGPDAADERGEAGQVVALVGRDRGQVLGRVQGLDVDALGGGPGQRVGVGALELLAGQLPPVVHADLRSGRARPSSVSSRSVTRPAYEVGSRPRNRRRSAAGRQVVADHVGHQVGAAEQVEQVDGAVQADLDGDQVGDGLPRR